MPSRPSNRGLAYIRRSSGKQEISLLQQLEWAMATAARHQVAFDAAPADLVYMQAHHLHSHKSIRLDDSITGSDLNRPGFLAVNADVLADPGLSHLFIYQRDRFARPEEALELVKVEKNLLEAGITLVFSNVVSLPYARGQQDIARDLGIWFGYYESGEFLRKHAERVLECQRRLALQGYRTGGNPPYGFARALVDGAGNILEILPLGKHVRQAGCHVRAVPHDWEKIAHWLCILDLKAQRGWGIKRIAKHLNERGIPSPDAGRTRTDHGVKHKVSGKWCANTVGELCRNPMILGMQEHGRRSEGKIRRLGAGGPRLLEEKDRTGAGKPKVIFNDPALRISKVVGEQIFDAEQWQKIQQQMDDRGRNQRGLVRAKDPGKYPLAGRLVDLTDGCGSILYGRTNQTRAVYTCGRYMRTAGAECDSNQVDAEAMLRFTLKTLKQFVDQHGRRDQLRAKLLERARRQAQEPATDPRVADRARLQTQRTDLLEQQATAEYRMARERDDNLYAALARQYQTAQAELAAVEKAIKQQEAAQASMEGQLPEAQVDAALTLLDDVTRITTDPAARAEVNPLLQRLGLRLGLTFGGAVKGKKRVVRRLLSGRMVFGDGALPVPLFGKDNVEDGPHGCGCGSPSPTSEATADQQTQERLPAGDAAGRIAKTDVQDDNSRERKQTAGVEECPTPAAAAGDQTPGRLNKCQPEGISITKVSRGDRRWTFPNEISGESLILHAVAQSIEFTADMFLAPAEA